MSLSPFADLRGLPYYDEPSLHMNLAGQLWALGVRGLEAREHVLEDRLLHPRRPVAAADDLPRPRRQGVLLLDPRQQPRELPGRVDEARDLLQRGRAHDRPRDPPAQRRARVPLLRRPALAALQARQLGRPLRRRDRPAPRLPVPDRRARPRWRRSSARPARASATSPSCASARPRSTGRPSRSAASACPATSPTSCAARSRTARTSTTPWSGGQGPRHPAPRLADVPRQPRRGRLPADELAVLQRRRPRPRLHGDGRRQRLQPARQRLRQRRPRRRAGTPAHPGRGRLAARGEVRPRLHRPRRAGGGGRRTRSGPSRRCAGTPTTSSTSTPPCCSPARSTRPSTSRPRRRGRRA